MATPLESKNLLAASITSMVIFAMLAAASVHRIDGLDMYIMHALNGVAHRSQAFDHLLNISTRDMFSTAILIALLCYVWFKHEDSLSRITVMMGVCTSVICGVASRAAQYLIVSHPRPFHEVALHFAVPYGMESNLLLQGYQHSSFPSDHAAVAGGLVTTIFLIDREVGFVGLVVAILSNFARVYMGLHYPIDVAGGAALGVFLMTVVMRIGRGSIAAKDLHLSTKKRPLFYAIAFYLCLGIGTLFADARTSFVEFWHAIHGTQSRTDVAVQVPR